MNQLTEDMAIRSGELLPWIVAPSRRDTTGVILSGLDALFILRTGPCWGNASHSESVWATANSLFHLSELPAKFLSYSRRQDIQRSLDWLTDVQDNGCWKNDERQPDCLCTAMAIIALRSDGRSVPAAALRFLEACRAADGSFAASPGQRAESDVLRALALTATASRALEYADPRTEDFLIKSLEFALPVPGSCNASRLYVCSEILDWLPGQASMSLLSKVSQLTIAAGDTTAFGQALLLRSLLRLGIPRSWAVAARLREMQASDGSWHRPSSRELPPALTHAPVTCANRAVVSATAVSALVMAESQPGLYLGSDRPLPRRF